MARVSSASWVVAALLLTSFAAANARRQSHREEEEFVAPEMQEYFKNEGGRVECISEKFKLLRDANLAAAVVTIEPNSLALPAYANVATLKYIIRGKARANLITPVGLPTNVKHLEKGDVLAVPKGWTVWIWNDGDEPLRMVGVARRSDRQGSHLRPQAFHLMGGKEEKAGGLVHGFSKKILARAWDVEEDDVQQLRESQQDAFFARVSEGDASKITWQQSSPLLGEFVHNVRRSDPDVFVRDGGMINSINGRKLPWLKHLDLSMSWIELEGGALLAPHYTNSWRLLHFVNGKGRIEMAHPDGRNALRTDFNAGDNIVVPAFYPVSICADENERLEIASFSNTELTIPAFLAGYNSLYHALPKEVLRQGLNLKEELLEKVYRTRRRRQEVAIFPRREEGGMKAHPNLFKDEGPGPAAFQAYLQDMERRIVEERGVGMF